MTTILGLKVKLWLVTTVLRIFITVVINHNFNFKTKTVIDEYGFCDGDNKRLVYVLFLNMNYFEFFFLKDYFGTKLDI